MSCFGYQIGSFTLNPTSKSIERAQHRVGDSFNGLVPSGPTHAAGAEGAALPFFFSRGGDAIRRCGSAQESGPRARVPPSISPGVGGPPSSTGGLGKPTERGAQNRLGAAQGATDNSHIHGKGELTQ